MGGLAHTLSRLQPAQVDRITAETPSWQEGAFARRVRRALPRFRDCELALVPPARSW